MCFATPFISARYNIINDQLDAAKFNSEEIIEKGDCSAVNGRACFENSPILPKSSTPEQAYKIKVLRAMINVLMPLFLCFGFATSISWFMVFPASILLVALIAIDLYLEQNDPNYFRYYA